MTRSRPTPAMLLKLFLLEDQTLFRDLIVRTLTQALDVTILGAFGTADELLKQLPAITSADVGLLDVRLDTGDCFELLPKIRSADSAYVGHVSVRRRPARARIGRQPPRGHPQGRFGR